MAGIGFELRRMMDRGSLTGKLEAYTFGAVIGSGPWVLSIVAVLAVGLLNVGEGRLKTESVDEFQVCVTYLMASSLTLTGLLQLLFTRFIADRLYERNDLLVLPNLLGALTVTFAAAGIAGLSALAFWDGGSFLFKQCMLTGFATLCGTWILMVFAGAIKAHRQILAVFFLGYSISVGASVALRNYGLEGLLLGFVIGQAFLFFTLLALVIREYPGSAGVSFQFLDRKKIYPSLILTGVFYNAGVWADKLIFWSDPLTSVHVVGPLRASVIYDFPIFLSYLSLIPGMAVFLMRVETEFADACAGYYETITSGGTLADVAQAKHELVHSVQRTMLAIVKVQGATTGVLLVMAPELLQAIGVPATFRPLLSIDLIAVAFQLLLLVVLNMLFYLDQRGSALRVCLAFLVLNIVLSKLTLFLGPSFYGYGFAAAVVLTLSIALVDFVRKLKQLEYQTFMLQPAFY